jgi:hypothetical protein
VAALYWDPRGDGDEPASSVCIHAEDE